MLVNVNLLWLASINLARSPPISILLVEGVYFPAGQGKLVGEDVPTGQ